MKTRIYLACFVETESTEAMLDRIEEYGPPVIFRRPYELQLGLVIDNNNGAVVSYVFMATLYDDQIHDTELVKRLLKERFAFPSMEVALSLSTALERAGIKHMPESNDDLPDRIIETERIDWLIWDQHKILDWLQEIQLSVFEIIPLKQLTNG